MTKTTVDPNATTTKRSRPSKGQLIAGTVIAVFAIGALASCLGGGSSTASTTAAAAPLAPVTVTVTAPAPAPVTVTAEAPAPVTVTAEPAAPVAPAVGTGPSDPHKNGKYLIGSKIDAGTWSCDEAKTMTGHDDISMAYWEVDGTEANDIIANGNDTIAIVSADGYTVKLDGCVGTWTKA